MPEAYFAIGTTLANMVNLETLITYPPHVLPGARIPLLGPVTRRTLNNAIQRNGSIDVPILIDALIESDLDTLITTEWGGYTVASAALYASWLDETGHYSPFAVTLERPIVGEHYQDVNKRWRQQITINGYGWTLQTNTENSSTTLLTSERYTESNTSGGAVVLTLPAASAVTPNTVYSAKKIAGGNALSFARAGSDTINGGTSLTVTTRTNIVSNGVSAWTSI